MKRAAPTSSSSPSHPSSSHPSSSHPSNDASLLFNLLDRDPGTVLCGFLDLPSYQSLLAKGLLFKKTSARARLPAKPDPHKSEVLRLDSFVAGLSSLAGTGDLLRAVAESGVPGGGVPGGGGDADSDSDPEHDEHDEHDELDELDGAPTFEVYGTHASIRRVKTAEECFLEWRRAQWPPLAAPTYVSPSAPTYPAYKAARDARNVEQARRRQVEADEWQKSAAVREPYEAAAATDAARLARELEEFEAFKARALRGDLGCVKPASFDQLCAVVGFHGGYKSNRGERDRFSLVESSLLLSLPRSSFTPAASETAIGERALILVSQSTRSTLVQYGGCPCCHPSTYEILETVEVSSLLPD
ncbi:hypothetical protein TeGR_g8963, partial [Tetraparma gracilis]